MNLSFNFNKLADCTLGMKLDHFQKECNNPDWKLVIRISPIVLFKFFLYNGKVSKIFKGVIL